MTSLKLNSSFLKTDLCTVLLASGLLWFISFVLQRIYNGLHKFPGPKLAAITRYYTAYYDIGGNGGMVDHLELLHSKYGPVVRTGPNELHFNDPRAHAAIYSMASKLPKDPYFYKGFAQDNCSFCLTDPVEARARHSIIAPMFSNRAIKKLEYLVQEKVDLLVKQLGTYDGPVNLCSAFRSASLDIISSYCFGSSYDSLTFPEFRHPLLEGIDSTIPVSSVFRHFSFLIPIFMSLPPWLHARLSPKSLGFNAMRDELADKIDKLLLDPSVVEKADHETIYHHLLQPQPTPSGPRMLPKLALTEESINLLIAGSDTVANTCAIGTFHVLNNKGIYSRLVSELDDAWDDSEQTMKHEVLAKLPYLTAVIKESLRLTHGVVTPLPRVVGPNSATIAGVEVPAGTVVSMGATFVHLNEDIFPEPQSFIPDRWLQPNSRELENYLIPFSKGPRACIGINLAWCELYLIFAGIFRKLSLEIYETTAKDFEFDAFFLPVYRGKPLRATVRSRSE